jgi:cell division protease FtsH
MVTEYGMSDKLGPVSFNNQGEVFLGRDYGHTQSYSEEIASIIDEEVKRIVQEGFNQAKQLLQENINRLHNVAEALLEREKLEAEEFEEIFAVV